jgi:hypothetical protein
MAIHAPLDIPKVLGKGIVELVGYFTLTSAGAASAVVGKGFTTASWTDNGAGDFTITLPGDGALIDILSVCLVAEDTKDLRVHLKEVSAANRTIRFELHTAGGAVNTDPSTGGKLRFHITVKNSSVS